jgi:HEAT repeat protein
MTLQRRFLTVALASGLILGIAWIAFRSNEPSYGGKTLGVWLEQLRAGNEINDPFTEVEIDTPATRAVRAMGREALPVLVRMARTTDTAMRRTIVEFAHHNEWLSLHPQSFDEIQTRTAYGFAVLGPAAKPALPELVGMLENRNAEVRLLAVFALGRIGPGARDAVPALQGLLDRAAREAPASRWNADEKILACYALGQMGPAARPALPQLRALKSDASIIVREDAEGAIIRITGAGVDAVVENLKDTSNQTNWLHAARTILSTGTNGAPAIPFLIAGLQHTNKNIQENAVHALGRIHLRPEICLPPLIPLLQLTNTNAFNRAFVLENVMAFGTNVRSYLPVSELVRMLVDGDGGVRAHATNALRQLYPQEAAKEGIN